MSRYEEEKKPIGFIIFAIILSIILAVLAALLIYQIATLQILPDNILIPVILLFVLFSLILILLLNFCTHGLVTKIIYSILVVAVSVFYGFGNYYLYSTNTTLSTVTDIAKQSKNTVSVIVLSSSEKTDVKDLNGSKIGVLKTIGKEGTQKGLKDIQKNGVSISKKKYDNVPSLLKALYENKVDAILLNEAYRSNVCDMQDYANFNSDTKVIHKTVYYTNEDSSALAVSDITTKPFSILISGNDSFGSLNENSRSDVDMVVTINPVTSMPVIMV